MKLLINTSNLYFGGGVQVALSFIEELRILNGEHTFHIFLSQVMNKQLDQEKYPSNFYFYLIKKSPAALKSRKKIVAQMDQLEKSIQPDIVFSVFGPSYWRPKAKHLLGFADGWLYNPQSVAYNRLNLLQRIKMRLYSRYKRYYLQRDGDYFVLETSDAKHKFAGILGIKLENIAVVGNTYSSVFDNKQLLQTNNRNYIQLPEKQGDEFRFVYIAHNHVSKNLRVINEVLPFLKEYNIKFVLTIEQPDFLSLFTKFRDKIINLGSVSLKSCPSVYHQCDALFAPTLLETFSAAYPEAMKMGLPILTSDYTFAKDICADTALYFDPLDPNDIVEKITNIINNKKLSKKLTDKGYKRLNSFETARSRAEKYIEICHNLCR